METFHMKRTIKLPENELRNLITESVSSILEDININPKNKDKFKRTQERTGKTTDELCHSKNPLTRKRANFAKMVKRHWKPLNESFNSNELRNWFKLHGGVMKTFEKDGYPNTNVKQDALSDVNDDDILYLEEFPSYNEAVRKMRQVKKSDSYGRRSDYDMKCYFTIYRANDGMCLLVGIDRNNIETGVTWGGEVSKKGSDRHWRDVHNLRHNYGTNKYTDDSDTYYYSKKGSDFGLYTNHQFKGKMKDNANIRNRMSDDEWNKYQKDRVNDMDSYLRKYYGKGLKENISRIVKTVLRESFEEQWEMD